MNSQQQKNINFRNSIWTLKPVNSKFFYIWALICHNEKMCKFQAQAQMVYMRSSFAVVSLTPVTLRWFRVYPSAIINQTLLVFQKGAQIQHTHTLSRLQHKQTAGISSALKHHRSMLSSGWTGPSRNGMCNTSTDETVFQCVCSYYTNILSVFIGWVLKGQKHREKKTDAVIIITGWEPGRNITLTLLNQRSRWRWRWRWGYRWQKDGETHGLPGVAGSWEE